MRKLILKLAFALTLAILSPGISLANSDFPDQWRLDLCIEENKGLHGELEKARKYNDEIARKVHSLLCWLQELIMELESSKTLSKEEQKILEDLKEKSKALEAIL